MEFIILAKRGKGHSNLRSKDKAIAQSFYTLFDKPPGGHSAKPILIYEVLDRLFNLR